MLSLKHDRKDEKDHNLYEKVAVGVFAHVVCACQRGLMREKWSIRGGHDYKSLARHDFRHRHDAMTKILYL